MNLTFIIMFVFFALMVVGGGYTGLVRMLFNMISFVLAIVASLILTLMLRSGFSLNAKGTVVCFAVCFVLAYVAMIIISFSLKIINTIPIVSTANNILGALVGAALAILIIWIFMSIMGALPASKFTTNVLSQIDTNPITKALYENNLVQVFLDNFLWKNAKISVSKLKDLSKYKVKFNISK